MLTFSIKIKLNLYFKDIMLKFNSNYRSLLRNFAQLMDINLWIDAFITAHTGDDRADVL